MLEKDIISFYSGYYTDMDIYQFACDAAYRDMCRTLEFTDKTTNNATHDAKIHDERKKMKNTFRNTIVNDLNSLNPTTYDDWHGKECEKLLDLYNKHVSLNSKKAFLKEKMTYGQAQKWLNMMMKHLWLLGQLYRLSAGDFIPKRASNFTDIYSDKEIEEKYSDVTQEEIYKILDCSPSFHIPLDSYILKYIAQESKAPKRKHERPQNTDIVQIDSLWNGVKMYEWSKIDNQKEYIDYQTVIRDDLASKGISPIEWELKHWHKAINFYNN